MEKFKDPFITAKGNTRAWVDLVELKTLWFNTGTQCNLSCENCYIESSPTNDKLVYISAEEVAPYLDEIETDTMIGLTGGEPFINPNIQTIIELILSKGHQLLVLTNAYRVLKRHQDFLLKINKDFPGQLFLRISLDHYTKDVHEKERSEGTFDKTISQLQWLSDNNLQISIAGRSLTSETVDEALKGYQKLLDQNGINLKLIQGENIIIFPEMIPDESVPEITTDCWGILNKTPEQQMCATERMIVKRKGAEKPVVLACTLLAYDPQFELGYTLKEAQTRVQLNHAYCAKFCVLGGASCSSAK
jgi:organic radical activating enzyme